MSVSSNVAAEDLPESTREYVGSMGPAGEPARESIAPHCALRYHGRNMTRSRREELEVERSKRF